MMTVTEGIGMSGADPFAKYAADRGQFDEAVREDGTVRSHWQAFARRFGTYSLTEQATRAEKLRRLVQENGIARDLFSEAHDTDEPWQIDLIPFILSPDEWRFLERAVEQRAKLSAAILDDLYGDQKLLQTGHIPPQLVLGDPTFLRAMSGTEAGRGRLIYCAYDFARDVHGNWRIVDTHTETLAGLGFALANRIVHSRVTSDLFLASNALRLAPFFAAMHGEMFNRAGRDDAPIALLTPGAHHEDYFGHAYLARYLSLLLVEGGDLRVVGNRLYMKTLEGLRPIDLILRCVAGEQADPLQLDPNGFFGPAGFLQAMQTNPDLSANAIGTAIAENRGLSPYLGALSEEVLGEELAVADQPRWWLGDNASRQHVLDNLDRMIIRPVQGGTGRPGRPHERYILAQMPEDQRRQFVQTLQLHGYRYVAEESASFATLPSWTPDGLQPRGFVVRVFATLVDGEYSVMPGGIALAVENDGGFGTFPAETHCRDVWVTSDAPVAPHASRLRTSLDSPQISRGNPGLRSRIADNLFWLGRYAERADWIMRLLRGALSRLDPDASSLQHRETVIAALDILLSKDEALVSLPREDAAIEQRARALMSGRGRSFGLIQTLNKVDQVAFLIRDRLSVELWRTLQIFQTSPVWRGDSEPQSLAEALDILDQGIATFAAFGGMAAENMTRNYGWNFLEIGRRIERASNLSELLATMFSKRQDEATEAASLTFALEVADSILTYRSRYLFAPVLPLVLDLLAADENNPRSLVFQLAAISEHLAALPQGPQPAPQSEERKLILDLLTRVRLADAHALSEAGSKGRREEFNALFTLLVSELPHLSEAITRRYFSLTEDEMTRIHPRFGSRP
ncbi:MAG: circularly permuted type 2 ATP-grasp protein [Rhodomicrobiaceae bacterium]